ncbi:MAG: hypothetical protein HY725_19520 [Candidatus Rokubacteria bacterium]|nr:hypothetical protein [Candidatus Rokubacteria bacterium]
MAQPAPFIFFGCIELREILGLRARDERELMEQLERAPLGSVYYHTHSVFLRHHQVTGAYPNDFANWVASQVRDQVLGERLAVVDPFAFGSLEALREELVSIIDHHVATLHPVPRVVFGDPFFFVQSHVIEVPAGLEARTLQEFRRCLAEVDASAIYLHTLESRVWRGQPHGDFAGWVERDLGLPSLAGAIARINPYLGGLEQARTRMLQLLDAALREAEPASGL